MKRTLTIALASLFAAAAALADMHGSWTANLDEKKPGRIYVQLHRGRQMHTGTTMNVAAFTGLSAAQINAATSSPVRFELRREAGNVTFDGSFRNGDGAGQFTFVPNRNYYAAIRSLGIDVNTGIDGDDDLFGLALHDVSTVYIRSMHAEGIRADLENYLAMRIFNVTPEYIREMRQLGFDKLDADELVATRVHNVSPEYIRQMRAAGWDLSLDELQASRIHGATPAFAEEMRRLGYRDLGHDELIAFRIHGVTAQLIRQYRELGYNDLTADDLVAMRIHGVTPDYIRELTAAGYRNIPVEKLISMRIHRIDVRKLR